MTVKDVIHNMMENKGHKLLFADVCGPCGMTRQEFRRHAGGCPRARKARCSDCGRVTLSDRPAAGYICIPFFRAEPTREYDSWYCGCRGWD